MNLVNSPAFSRIAPFAVFMLFIGSEELAVFIQQHVDIGLGDVERLWLYLPRVAITGVLLWAFRNNYREIVPRDLLNLRHLLISIVVGGVIFALWIEMDWTLSSQSAPSGFDPYLVSDPWNRWLLIAIRCFGAIIVVPVMEELFWRSFLIRYLIDSNFMAVAIGRLSWFAFLATTLLFGLEHHYFVAGIMAGIFFTLVYAWTRSIVHCIVCHMTANLCLAGYVLVTQRWQFW